MRCLHRLFEMQQTCRTGIIASRIEKEKKSKSRNLAHANISPVLNKLLQLLDLVAEFLGRRKAFCCLHKESRHLVAAQQAGDTTLQSMKQAGLHNS